MKQLTAFCICVPIINKENMSSFLKKYAIDADVWPTKEMVIKAISEDKTDNSGAVCDDQSKLAENEDTKLRALRFVEGVADDRWPVGKLQQGEEGGTIVATYPVIEDGMTTMIFSIGLQSESSTPRYKYLARL